MGWQVVAWSYLEGLGFSVVVPLQHLPQQAPQAQDIAHLTVIAVMVTRCAQIIASVFAVLTHSRLRDARSFPAMFRATLRIRHDLARARGLLRAANLIAGPTEFLTFTVWSDRDAMRAFMSSGAHERIMWRWPDWLRAFWLGRLAPVGNEHGTWRGLSVSKAAGRGTAAHAEYVAPSFASHEQRPRDLESLGLGAALCVLRPTSLSAWPTMLAQARRLPRMMSGPDVFARVTGYSLDAEYVGVAICRDARFAAEICSRTFALGGPGVSTWAMSWRPLDEFGTWDGRRFRLLASRRIPDRV